MHNLEGKVALVTGGTRGIGRGIAEAFLSAGASVAINGRSAEKGAATIREWSAGDRAFYIAGDVTQKEEVEAMVDAKSPRCVDPDLISAVIDSASQSRLLG